METSRDAVESQHDAGVLWVVWLLGLLQTFFNGVFYRPLQWKFSRGRLVNFLWVAEVLQYRGPPGLVRVASSLVHPLWPTRARAWRAERTPWVYFNYVYSTTWLVLLLGGYIATTCWHASWFRWLVLAFAWWRVAETFIWQVKMLLDRTHRLILSAERNLLLLFSDAMVVATAVALMLTFTDRVKAVSSDAFSTWIDSLSVITLNGRPSGYSGVWSDAATLIGTFGGLLFIGAGLAVLVGLIQQKFLLDRDEYTSPMRITRPKSDGVLQKPKSR